MAESYYLVCDVINTLKNAYFFHPKEFLNET